MRASEPAQPNGNVNPTHSNQNQPLLIEKPSQSPAMAEPPTPMTSKLAVAHTSHPPQRAAGRKTRHVKSAKITEYGMTKTRPAKLRDVHSDSNGDKFGST